MKTIIISDIDSDKETIIPFGLNIGKHTETTADIIHILDPRAIQGVQSQYADSQTIAPGDKLSHQTIMEREKDKACRALDKLISAEGSRLNYPLKININVEENKLESFRNALEKDHPDSVLVTSTQPDGTIFQGKDELMGFIRDTRLPVVTVPPSKEFDLPDTISVIIDLTGDSAHDLAPLSKFLEPFGVPVNFIGIARQKDLQNLDENIHEWKQKMDTYTHFPGFKNINIATGDSYFETLKDQLSKSNSAWMAVPRKHSWDGGMQLFTGEKYRDLITSEEKPFIFY